jgi:hypothetical protein
MDPNNLLFDGIHKLICIFAKVVSRTINQTVNKILYPQL